MESPLITGITVVSLVILLLVLILRKFQQPHFVAYIAAGILLGPEVLNVFERKDTITELGDLGIVLLMFFIGAEVDLAQLTKNFTHPLLAAGSQLIFSYVLIYFLSFYFAWDTTLVILLSFIISLSSSAIVFQYLSTTGQVQTPLGLMACGVLLIQDILVVPMMLTLNFIGEGAIPVEEMAKAIIGALLCGLFLWAALSKKVLHLPFKDDIASDHDLQVFIGFLLCFGMAWLTAFFGLSAALGAFMAGIIIGQDKSTKWLDTALVPFRVFFMAFFFISVGLQIDIHFFRASLGSIAALTLCILIINSLVNSLVFRFTGHTWRDSLYAGALLSQIGEFSFVLMTLARTMGLVSDIAHQLILAVIAMSMMLSAAWIKAIHKFVFRTL